jgi:hypothetical protein
MFGSYIEQAKKLLLLASKSSWLEHSARTGLAAAASSAIAHLFRMLKVYWAAVALLPTSLWPGQELASGENQGRTYVVKPRML